MTRVPTIDDAQLLIEAEELDGCYARAAAFDAEKAAQSSASDDEDAEDEMELLRRAALSRGQP